MKQILDFLPVTFFVIAYFYSDIYVATSILMLAMVGQILFVYLKYKKVSKQLQISFFVIMIFGGLTLSFQDKTFIQWKPTVVNWFFAIALICSQIFGEKNLLERMLGEKLKLPVEIWRNLNTGWAIGFLISGLLNLYVAYNFSEATWVTYKFVGGFVITSIYIFITIIYLRKQKYSSKRTVEKN